MKKPYLLLLLIFASCTHIETKQQKAENLVKAYLKTSLNDPGSYEGVSFDTLSVSYEEYASGDPKGRKLDTLAASYIDTSSKYRKLADSESYSTHMDFKKYKRYQKLDTLFSKKSDSVENIEKINGKGYRGRIVGYAIKHTYRAKNGFGGLTLNYTDFWIDSTLTKIINVQDGNITQR